MGADATGHLSVGRIRATRRSRADDAARHAVDAFDLAARMEVAGHNDRVAAVRGYSSTLAHATATLDRRRSRASTGGPARFPWSLLHRALERAVVILAGVPICLAVVQGDATA